MKAVNRVQETDRLPFLKALAHVAAADDTVSLNEKKMVKQYEEAWELAEPAQQQIHDILDAEKNLSLKHLVSEFSESGTRFLLVQELMRLSYADGTYGDVERRAIAAIAQQMGMGERQFREVEKWVGRGQAWETSDDEGPDEDRLQDLLGEEADEEGEEEDDYDLSDIDTTDESDLSDIDPGGYELDEEELEELKGEMEDESDGTDEEAQAEDRSGTAADEEEAEDEKKEKAEEQS